MSTTVRRLDGGGDLGFVLGLIDPDSCGLALPPV
jgi:hypothetical protein